jgi:hypothetical protein
MSHHLYDWSSVTRHSIVKHLRPLRKALHKKTIDVDILYQLISRKLKEKYPVSTKKAKLAKSPGGRIAIGGLYYPSEDKIKKRCICIVFNFNKKDSEIHITGKIFNRILTLIADSILHEIIHMRQYRRRNFYPLPDSKMYASEGLIGVWQRYYGQHDEIDAHSFNIACELIESFTEPEKIKKFLKSNTCGKSCNLFNTYIKYFNNNHSHPVIKALKKKVLHYVPYAVVGKPFKRASELSGNTC